MSGGASADTLFANVLSYGAALAATWAAAQLVSLWTLNLPVSDMLKVYDLQLYSTVSEANPAEAEPQPNGDANTNKGQYRAGQAADEALAKEAMELKTPPYRGANSGGNTFSTARSGVTGASGGGKQRRGSRSNLKLQRLSWSSSIRRLPSFSPREMYEQKVLAASTADLAKGPRIAPPKGHKPNPKALFASNESKRIIAEQGGKDKMIAELRANVQDLLDASADARRYCDEDTMMRCEFVGE